MAVCYISCGLALDMTSATNVGFLMSLPIVFTPFIAVFVLRKPYRLIYLPVQLTILVGLYMLCSNSGSFAFGWGEAFAILTSISCAASFVFSEQSLKALDEITISATQIWLTFALSLPWAILLERDFSPADVTVSSWLVVLYLAVFSTLIAFRLQNVALTKISSHTVSTLICSEPVFTAIVSRFLLGEILSPIGLTGSIIIMVCIFGGNYIFSMKDNSTPTNSLTICENPPA